VKMCNNDGHQAMKKAHKAYALWLGELTNKKQ